MRSRQTGQTRLRSIGVSGIPQGAEYGDQDDGHNKCECYKYAQKDILFMKPLHTKYVFLSCIFMNDLPHLLALLAPPDILLLL